MQDPLLPTVDAVGDWLQQDAHVRLPVAHLATEAVHLASIAVCSVAIFLTEAPGSSGFEPGIVWFAVFLIVLVLFVSRWNSRMSDVRTWNQQMTKIRYTFIADRFRSSMLSMFFRYFAIGATASNLFTADWPLFFVMITWAVNSYTCCFYPKDPIESDQYDERLAWQGGHL